jgi:hypothetical protein
MHVASIFVIEPRMTVDGGVSAGISTPGYGRIKATGQHCNKLLPIARHSPRQTNEGRPSSTSNSAKSSFDDRVGTLPQRLRNGQAYSFGCSEIHGELEFDRLLRWRASGLGVALGTFQFFGETVFLTVKGRVK